MKQIEETTGRVRNMTVCLEQHCWGELIKTSAYSESPTKSNRMNFTFSSSLLYHFVSGSDAAKQMELSTTG